jgi:hypothetical protein
MLHSLPALLDELEQRLIQGVDPQPLLSSLRWPEVINWPTSREEAARIKDRLAAIQALLNGLQAPLRATLSGLTEGSPYVGRGGSVLPRSLSVRVHQSV